MSVAGRFQTACDVKTRRELVRQRLVVDEVICLGRLDRGLVKTFGIQRSPFDSSDLRRDQKGAVFEILRAVLCPFRKLPMVSGQSLNMPPILIGTRRIAACRMA